MEGLFASLFGESSGLNHSFIADGATQQDVHDLAARFGACFLELDPAVPICLAAQNRDVIAAALLAAVTAGRVLALPHSFSARALRQMQDITGFNTAIVDVHRELSFGTRSITANDVKTLKPLVFSASEVNPDAELVKLFTGGSTGAAKIWSKTVANIFGEAQFMAARYTINEKDIILATITPYHIYGLLFSVVIPLLAKAAIVADNPSFPAEIEACIKQKSVTILASVPAHYRALQGRTLSPSLRLAISSAGMLPENDNNGFCKQNRAQIVEVYGSTETGGLASRNRAAGEEFFHPLEPVEWQIKDHRFYVRSPFLSPDVPVDRDNFFLSGDRVRLQSKSSFSLHGRADAITKVAGERVDLDEIRDILQKQRAVTECVVVPLLDTSGRGNRIAALVCSDQEELDLAPIKLVLSVSLEPAAMPKIIRQVAHIPIKTNGKYDMDEIARLLS